MCGRARCTLGPDGVPRACHRTAAPARTLDMGRYRPSYNVSPGFYVPVIRRDDGSASAGGGGGSEKEEEEEEEGYTIQCMRWGLIPSFAKKTDKPDFFKMFNARSESVAEKASFRRLLPKNRCLVAVEGFYEWKKDGSKKQPYYIHFKDGRPLVFAALYDTWQDSQGEILCTFTIVTTTSSSALKWLHDRMPVILGDKEATDTWLNGSSSSKYDAVLKPYEEPDLVWYAVTPAMGKISFDGPECIKEIQLKKEEKSTISKFFSRKEVKAEQESDPVGKSPCDLSVKTDLPKNVREEYEMENQLSTKKEIKEEQEPIADEKGACDKSARIDILESVKHEGESEDKLETPSIVKLECETKRKTKRDHKELPADSELTRDKNDKLPASPAKKKANLKSGGDKQPTLLSFFSKK